MGNGNNGLWFWGLLLSFPMDVYMWRDWELEIRCGNGEMENEEKSRKENALKMVSGTRIRVD